MRAWIANNPPPPHACLQRVRREAVSPSGREAVTSSRREVVTSSMVRRLPCGEWTVFSLGVATTCMPA